MAEFVMFYTPIAVAFWLLAGKDGRIGNSKYGQPDHGCFLLKKRIGRKAETYFLQ